MCVCVCVCVCLHSSVNDENIISLDHLSHLFSSHNASSDHKQVQHVSGALNDSDMSCCL